MVAQHSPMACGGNNLWNHVTPASWGNKMAGRKTPREAKGVWCLMSKRVWTAQRRPATCTSSTVHCANSCKTVTSTHCSFRIAFIHSFVHFGIHSACVKHGRPHRPNININPEDHTIAEPFNANFHCSFRPPVAQGRDWHPWLKRLHQLNCSHWHICAAKILRAPTLLQSRRGLGFLHRPTECCLSAGTKTHVTLLPASHELSCCNFKSHIEESTKIIFNIHIHVSSSWDTKKILFHSSRQYKLLQRLFTPHVDWTEVPSPPRQGPRVQRLPLTFMVTFVDCAENCVMK